MTTVSERLKQELEHIDKRVGMISMEEAKMIASFIKDAYSKEPDEKGRRRTWEATKKFDALMYKFLVIERTELLLDGYWAGYYFIRKFERTPEKVADLKRSIRDRCNRLSEEETPAELFVSWGYIFLDTSFDWAHFFN